MKNIKKTMAVIATVAAGLGLVAGGMAGAIMFPKTVVEPVLDNEAYNLALKTGFEEGKLSVDTENIYTNGFNAGVESVEPIIVNNTVTETVSVDSESLPLVLDHIYDNDGKIEYLLDDLDDDEVDQIVDRIVFVNEIKKLATDYVERKLADEVDKEVVNATELDEDDVEKIRLDNDDDEIEVDNIDFEDKDAELTVTGKFRHDDVWYVFSSTVEIEDGNVEDFSVDTISEE